jgi:ATP-binding protein involved in chromosome partitioning
MNPENSSTKKKQSEELRLKENLDRIKYKLIVISGKGGVGKSTVAVNVAFGLAAQGKKVGLLDVDIHGPSIAKMLGIEGKALEISPTGKYAMPVKVNENLYAMTIASLIKNPDEPVIWRGPLKMGAIKQFLQDIRWPELDYLIVDSPPGTGDEPLSVIQILKKVDGSLIVSTPQDLALLDVRKTIKFSQKMNVPIIGLIENMSTFVCPHCGKEINIFKGFGVKKAARDFNIDVIGKIPIDINIAESGDKGKSFLSESKNKIITQRFNEIINSITEKLEK